MKRSLLLLFILSPVLVLAFVLNAYPIFKLKDWYPQITRSEGKSTLSFVRKRPKDWVPIRKVSSYLKWAIVASEDWSFYQHIGIDFRQLRLAIADAWENDHAPRGASTITQQVVKNIFFSNQRSYVRKVIEMILCPILETLVTKDRILEIYFNIIEFGPDLYGINKASRYYFEKNPYQIGPREGAYLAMLLPNPKLYSKSFFKGKLTEYQKGRIQRTLWHMKIMKIISLRRYHREQLKRFYWERPRL